ncbi:MAG: bacillithiol biosynthesis BshC [Bacteroidetes bacterium]|nr:bacillithiol biosynthesis BshC [Bacteroidota bacterium]
MPTQKSTISYAQSNYFSKLILEYISGSDKLNYFYNAKPEIASFSAIIEAKSKETINRNLLYEVIDQQYKNGNCTVPNANLQLLSQENTFTVTTGHQLCLFTGPLYFIYKIISTINLAEALKANYPNFNFVPFYWMASEDHDFAEVNHIHVFGKKIEFNPTMPTSSIPVGKISTEGIQVVLDEIKSILGESESAKQLVALFDNAYKNSKNLADATRILVHSLFGHYGLVVLDADDARLKKNLRL